MRRDLFSPYHHGTSALHRLPAGVKLGFVLCAVLLIALLPVAAWIAYGSIAVVVVALTRWSGVPAAEFLRRLLWLEPFAIGVALLGLARPDGPAAFLSLLVRSTLCLSWMVLLTTTTRFGDLLAALRSAHVPSLLVTTLALMHRYLFVLRAELERMLRARRSRTFRSGRAQSWRGSAQAAGLLFVRSTERAERIYAAMRARGWKP